MNRFNTELIHSEQNAILHAYESFNASKFFVNLPTFVHLIQTNFLTKVNKVLTASISVSYKTLDIVGQYLIHHVSMHELD